ncbi:MAG: shikimate kinase [Vallitaleaceae bacterium]|jgi:shikimate kinase|nr:shikimate kinase [Vallitaleaceae bacterium]
MNNIYLIGFMGSGKTTVGKELAAKLNRDLVDMDYEIEQKQGISIKEIFELQGENAFRDMETNFLKRIEGLENKVISTGGGVILKEENCKSMKSGGKVIFLHAREEQRLRILKPDDKRPLLAGADYQERISTLLGIREQFYLDAADIIIQATGKNIQDIVQEIIVLL